MGRSFANCFFSNQQGIAIGGKSMAEYLETINHREAILFVEDLASNQEPQ